MKRVRAGARVVVLDSHARFLLMRFAYRSGPLAGTGYWGLPGGGLEAGESPAAGAARELREETGLRIEDVGEIVAETRYDLRLCSGETVRQHDRYFLARVEHRVALSQSECTAEEKENLAEMRWWSLAELLATRERLLPEDMAEIVAGILARAGDRVHGPLPPKNLETPF